MITRGGARRGISACATPTPDDCALAGAVPTILKINSANSLARAKEDASQAITGSVGDALLQSADNVLELCSHAVVRFGQSADLILAIHRRAG